MVEQYKFSNANPDLDPNIFNVLTSAFSIYPEVLNLFILGASITIWIMAKKNCIPAIITTIVFYLLFAYLFNINMFSSIIQMAIASANLVFIIFAVVEDMNIR